ncbi:fumarylacetoacetate hydrolase family protein [Azospirillum sp. CT11-132]|uniref:fumarylacetoacetate hydrolase family protein n=1 Tax=Azospirillum sp. CT11-132 TaxID=3396317 RepID=UPI0039A50001
MKLLSYLPPGSPDGQARYGAMTDRGIVDLTARIGVDFPSLRALIAADALETARRVLAAADGVVDHDPTEVIFLPPIPEPQKIWCIGVNYRDRNAEYRDNSDLPKYPSLFVRAPTSFVGHGQPVVRPRQSEQLDYEGELVLVIGKAARHVTAERALDHVFGMTLANEGTVRDWLRHGKFNVTQGKNFDRSGSIGPWIVTADELALDRPLDLSTRVNGELRQQDDTGRLMFPFADLIAYLTSFATLMPGDLILTGTPTGAGARFDPPRWLEPGDRVEVECTAIGTLRNDVVDEE